MNTLINQALRLLRKKSYSEYCQPCGECDWCQNRFKAKTLLIEAARRERTMFRLLKEAYLAINEELSALGESRQQVRESYPTEWSHWKLCDKIEKFLKAHEGSAVEEGDGENTSC